MTMFTFGVPIDHKTFLILETFMGEEEIRLKIFEEASLSREKDKMWFGWRFSV